VVYQVASLAGRCGCQAVSAKRAEATRRSRRKRQRRVPRYARQTAERRRRNTRMMKNQTMGYVMEVLECACMRPRMLLEEAHTSPWCRAYVTLPRECLLSAEN